jgi:hypothetical protein
MRRRAIVFQNCSGRLTVGVLFLAMSGCAGLHRELGPEERAQLSGARIGVVTLIPGRNVRITKSSEYLIATKVQTQMIDLNRIWDPGLDVEAELQRNWSSYLPSEPKPLRSSLNNEDYHLLVGHREQDIFRQSESSVIGGATEEAYRSLYVGEFDYLLEFIVGKLFIEGGTFQSTNLGVVLYGRLIRLKDGAILWKEKILTGKRLEGMKKLEDFSEEKFKILRTAFGAVAQATFDPGSDFILGLKPR